MESKIAQWLKDHQYVAAWTTLATCLVGLYEISKLGG